VIEWLNDQQLDLLELSGGNCEAPAMQGEARDGRTLAREAYFLEMAIDLAGVAFALMKNQSEYQPNSRLQGSPAT
jgi:hypothetical protein